MAVGQCAAWYKCFSYGCCFIPLGFKIKQSIAVFSEGINHEVGLIICRVGCIAVVVVKIGQLTIVMLFKPFILILRGVSGTVDNGPLMEQILLYTYKW